MKERILKILETKYNLEKMTIEQLTKFYELYEKVKKKEGVK